VESTDYAPFAIVAVALETEQLVVLGQVALEYGLADLAIGKPVELVLEELYKLDGVSQLIWRWRPILESANS
jgi:hypothetical protein